MFSDDESRVQKTSIEIHIDDEEVFLVADHCERFSAIDDVAAAFRLKKGRWEPTCTAMDERYTNLKKSIIQLLSSPLQKKLHLGDDLLDPWLLDNELSGLKGEIFRSEYGTICLGAYQQGNPMEQGAYLEIHLQRELMLRTKSSGHLVDEPLRQL